MKPLKHLLSLFALMVVILCCNQSSVQEGLIIGQGVPPNQWEPEIDLESHKTGDVEIHRVLIPEEGYIIIFYHDYSGKIQNYHSYCYDTINYNQGFYSWQNDTTVTVKLLNSESKKEWSVELGMRGGSSFMRLLD